MANASGWAKVPVAVVSDHRLTQRELRVYIALAAFADRNGDCWPKRDRVSEITGIHPNHITNASTRLCQLGYLLKIGNGGRGRPARYRCVIPDNTTGTGRVYGDKTLPDGRRVYGGETLPAAVANKAKNPTATGRGKEQTTLTGDPFARSPHPRDDGVSIDRVMELYNELLPELPKARAAAAAMVSDFAELKGRYSKCEAEDWWQSYFEAIRQSRFLMDTTGQKKRKRTTLAWLLKYDNAAKVINGEFVDNEPSDASLYGRTLGGGTPEWMRGAI